MPALVACRLPSAGVGKADLHPRGGMLAGGLARLPLSAARDALKDFPNGNRGPYTPYARPVQSCQDIVSMNFVSPQEIYEALGITKANRTRAADARFLMRATWQPFLGTACFCSTALVSSRRSDLTRRVQDISGHSRTARD